jgi:hypothetical protein
MTWFILAAGEHSNFGINFPNSLKSSNRILVAILFCSPISDRYRLDRLLPDVLIGSIELYPAYQYFKLAVSPKLFSDSPELSSHHFYIALSVSCSLLRQCGRLGLVYGLTLL